MRKLVQMSIRMYACNLDACICMSDDARPWGEKWAKKDCPCLYVPCKHIFPFLPKFSPARKRMPRIWCSHAQTIGLFSVSFCRFNSVSHVHASFPLLLQGSGSKSKAAIFQSYRKSISGIGCTQQILHLGVFTTLWRVCKPITALTADHCLWP